MIRRPASQPILLSQSWGWRPWRAKRCARRAVGGGPGRSSVPKPKLSNGSDLLLGCEPSSSEGQALWAGMKSRVSPRCPLSEKSSALLKGVLEAGVFSPTQPPGGASFLKRSLDGRFTLEILCAVGESNLRGRNDPFQRFFFAKSDKAPRLWIPNFQTRTGGVSSNRTRKSRRWRQGGPRPAGRTLPATGRRRPPPRRPTATAGGRRAGPAAPRRASAAGLGQGRGPLQRTGSPGGTQAHPHRPYFAQQLTLQEEDPNSTFRIIFEGV